MSRKAKYISEQMINNIRIRCESHISYGAAFKIKYVQWAIVWHLNRQTHREILAPETHDVLAHLDLDIWVAVPKYAVGYRLMPEDYDEPTLIRPLPLFGSAETILPPGMPVSRPCLPDGERRRKQSSSWIPSTRNRRNK